MSIQITVTGNVGNIPTFKNIPRKDGTTVPVCNFSLASSDYRRVGDDDFEQVGETAWLECSYFGDKAESLAKVLQKGMPLIGRGREQLRKSIIEKDGQTQTYTNRVLNVEQIGLNLLSPRIEVIKLRPAKEGGAPADPETSTANESDIPF